MSAQTEDVTNRRAYAPYALTALAWCVAVGVFWFVHRDTATLALSAVGYALLLSGISVWLLPTPDACGEALNAAEPEKTWGWRLAVVIVFFFVPMVAGFAESGASGGIFVPILTPWFSTLMSTGMPWGGYTATDLYNFASLALIPCALLLALGLRPLQLGLGSWAPRSWLATLLCLLVPIGMVAFALARGKIGVAGLLFLLVHNLLSNGFSEEFFARGMIMSHLRARLPTDWAIVLQAVLWALPHAGGTVVEEHGNPVLILLNVLVLNVPMGIALGIMAARSRSLAMPTLVHISLDTMARLVRG